MRPHQQQPPSFVQSYTQAPPPPVHQWGPPPPAAQAGSQFGGGFGNFPGGPGGRMPTTPPPFIHNPESTQASPGKPFFAGEERNLHDTMGIMQHPPPSQLPPGAGTIGPYGDGTFPDSTGGPGMAGRSNRSEGRSRESERRPFMQSLTSMHHSPTRVEADLAQRRRNQWLTELNDQVRARDEQRQVEKTEREIEEMKEELRARSYQQTEEEELRRRLAMAKPAKGK